MGQEGIRVRVALRRFEGGATEIRSGRLVSGDPLVKSEGSTVVVHLDGDASPTFGVAGCDVVCLDYDFPPEAPVAAP